MVEREEVLPENSKQFEAPRIEGEKVVGQFENTEQTTPEAAPSSAAVNPVEQQPAKAVSSIDIGKVISGEEFDVTALQQQIGESMVSNLEQSSDDAA